MPNPWAVSKKPIMALAPMEGVTDTAFRQVLVSIGKPDLMFTEFTNVSAIFSHDTTAVNQRLKFKSIEQPLIAQIWGLDPELFEASAALLVKMGFAGIDLNFGCPDKAVVKQGACAALIDDRTLVKEIILATQKGAAGKVPISVKTRLGLNKIVTEDWTSFLLGFDLAAITIHGRTAKEKSEVPVHWDEIGKAVKIRDKQRAKTLILGNGDVFSLREAREKTSQFNLDGIMIGRGIFKDPWLFNPKQSIEQKTTEEKLNLLLNHARLYHSQWGITKSFHILKRFFKVYASGFRGALKLREQLMATNSLAEVENIISKFGSL